MKEDNFGFKTVLKNFLEAFNIEKGIIPTIKDLLINPAKVINDYIDGGRDKYFAPGRFFVTMLTLLSFMTWMSGGFDLELYKSILMEDINNNTATNQNPYADFIATNMLYVINNATYRLPLLILPSAYISWIIFYKYRFNLAKHFVFHIYSWTFINLILAIVSVLINQEEYLKASVGTYDIHKTWQHICYEWFYYLFPVIYYIYFLKNIFNLNRLEAVIRPVLFVSITFITFMIGLVLLFALAVIIKFS